MNGSAAIHDFELALAGKTSEDVGAQLHAGKRITHPRAQPRRDIRGKRARL